MGCCVSTLDENKANPNSKQNSIKKDPRFPCVSKSPPRPEEETVKEVLSVTPKPDSEPETKLPNYDQLPTKSKSLVSTPKKPFLQLKETKYYPDPSTPEEEISEVSDICSLSETISTTTLEDQLQQQMFNRSQGHNSDLLRNNNYNCIDHNVQLKNHRRSPVRRADPSPPRRMYSGTGRVGPMRDVVGENSFRRSRSPAKRANVGRSPSARRIGLSPGRVRMVNGPDGVRNANVDDNGREWAGPKESLENPLVSLECFIFL